MGVSISGDRAIVGAWGNDDEWRGSAYVFHLEETGWKEEAKLTPSDAAPADINQFGGRWTGSVSISGDLAIVGAPQDPAGRALDDAGTTDLLHGVSLSASVLFAVLAVPHCITFDLTSLTCCCHFVAIGTKKPSKKVNSYLQVARFRTVRPVSYLLYAVRLEVRILPPQSLLCRPTVPNCIPHGRQRHGR